MLLAWSACEIYQDFWLNVLKNFIDGYYLIFFRCRIIKPRHNLLHDSGDSWKFVHSCSINSGSPNWLTCFVVSCWTAFWILNLLLLCRLLLTAVAKECPGLTQLAVNIRPLFLLALDFCRCLRSIFFNLQLFRIFNWRIGLARSLLMLNCSSEESTFLCPCLPSLDARNSSHTTVSAEVSCNWPTYGRSFDTYTTELEHFQLCMILPCWLHAIDSSVWITPAIFSSIRCFTIKKCMFVVWFPLLA
jgi:hypothetical protein